MIQGLQTDWPFMTGKLSSLKLTAKPLRQMSKNSQRLIILRRKKDPSSQHFWICLLLVTPSWQEIRPYSVRKFRDKQVVNNSLSWICFVGLFFWDSIPWDSSPPYTTICNNMFGSLQVSHPMYMAIFSAPFQDSCNISGRIIATSHDLGSYMMV